MTNSAELLPCPFCGCEVVRDFKAMDFGGPKQGHVIDCNRCNGGFHSTDRAQSVERWNTRAESRPSLRGDVVELLGNPNEWANKKDELLMWTGSAFLAGETHSSDGDLKGDLYGFLCGLVGWLTTGELAARAALDACGGGWRPTDAQIKHMTNRFLMWPLPENFSPDAGISFKPTFNEHLPTPMKHNPIGTNLFSAEQAEAMIRYMLEGVKQEGREAHWAKWPNGDAGDAIDYACDHATEPTRFLEDWRSDDLGDWEGYRHWLKTQRDKAREASPPSEQEEG